MSWEIAALAVSAAAQAAMQVRAGNAQKSAMESQAAQQREAAEETRAQAMQEETARRERLRMLTSTNLAELTTRGVSSDSPSFIAIGDENVRQGSMDISNIRYMGASRSRRYDMAAENSESAGRQAQIGGYISAIGTLAGAGYSGYRYMGGGKTPSSSSEAPVYGRI